MGDTHQYTMGDEDNEFAIETADAGASLVQAVEAGSIRKGGYIMIKGKACKVKDVSVSKTGKHGHAKCKFLANDIFTGNTCEELCPSTHSIDVPVVTKTNWMITGLEGDYVLLMNDEGDMREDLQLPTVMGFSTSDDVTSSKLIQDYCQMVEDGSSIDILCTVLSAIKLEKITDVLKKDA